MWKIVWEPSTCETTEPFSMQRHALLATTKGNIRDPLTSATEPEERPFKIKVKWGQMMFSIQSETFSKKISKISLTDTFLLSLFRPE
jgi:hypothetical protein